MFTGMLPAANKQVAEAAPSTATSGSPLSPTSGALDQGVTLTTTNGTVISLPNYPAQISKNVATTGANGTTALLANQLESIGQQLLASGELTQDQYNALVALANQGHYIGQMERTLEQIAANSTDAAAFKATLMQYPELAGIASGDYYLVFGYGTGSSDPTLVTDPLGSVDIAHGATKDFLLLYQEVLNSGALNDPAVKQLVDTLTADIGYLSEVALDSAIDITYGAIPPSQMQEQMVSDTTHLDSQQICTTGSGTDTGTQCQ
jgi:hypothetical protein